LQYYNVNKIGNAFINVVTVWCIHLTISQWKNINVSCVCDSFVESLSAALKYCVLDKKCFYGKFMSPAAIQIIHTIF